MARRGIEQTSGARVSLLLRAKADQGKQPGDQGAVARQGMAPDEEWVVDVEGCCPLFSEAGMVEMREGARIA